MSFRSTSLPFGGVSGRGSGSKTEPPWRVPLVGEDLLARWLLLMRRGVSAIYTVE